MHQAKQFKARYGIPICDFKKMDEEGLSPLGKFHQVIKRVKAIQRSKRDHVETFMDQFRKLIKGNISNLDEKAKNRQAIMKTYLMK